MTQFITKNKKVVPFSVRKMSDSQLEKIIKEGNSKLKKIESKHGEAYILKDKKLDALAEKVAQATITKRERAFKKLQEDNERDHKTFAEKNPEVRILEALQKDPNFKMSGDHTYGWKDTKIDLPTYIPVKTISENNEINEPFEYGSVSFKGEGSEGISFVDADRLKLIRQDAFKNKLLSRRNSFDAFRKEAKIFVSPNPDRPILIHLKSRSYILAPRVRN